MFVYRERFQVKRKKKKEKKKNSQRKHYDIYEKYQLKMEYILAI